MGFSIKNIFSHKNLFVFGLCVMAIGLPLSSFLMSIGQFILLGNWVWQGEWQQKWERLKKTKWITIFFAFYFLHLLGMLWTQDYDYGIKDLKIKLPLLWMPLLFFSSEPLAVKQFNYVLKIFVSAVFLSTIIGLFVFLGFSNKKVIDSREISIFISHIRLSLMIVFSIIILLTDQFKVNLIVKTILTIWFVCFLLLMESLTGIIVLIFVLILLLGYYLVNRKKTKLILAFMSVFVLLAGLFSFVVISEWNKFYAYQIKPIKKENCLTTQNNRHYFNNFQSKERENGNPIWTCIQIEELRKEWNKRSRINFDSLGYNKNPIATTLIRYLASKSLRKDSASVATLRDEEIKCIENGVTNYNYKKIGSISSRVHEVIWEYDNYYRNGNPNGHSVAMRIEFWKCAAHIIRNNFLFGVGTGDVKKEFDKYYETSKSKLKHTWWLRSHNQFLTSTSGLGIIAFILLIIILALPFFVKYKYSLLLKVFSVIVFLSMLTEDTLETQAGVTFFALFYFFLFSFNHDDKTKENKL